MKKENVILKDEIGLHARPAAELAKIATKYESKIFLNVKGKRANAKSMMGILSLGVTTNSEVEIECDGNDEDEALKEIVEAFNNNFGK